MMPILKYLNDRLSQLEHRKMMIPRYVKRPGDFLGKKDFSLDDLPAIEQDINETKIAIKSVELYRKFNGSVVITPTPKSPSVETHGNP